jgi:uncharacterized protein YigA (DUF484 family)
MGTIELYQDHTHIKGQVYDRHIEQLRRDFSLALAIAEQRDKLNLETDKLTELQRLASLLEQMRKDVTDAQERVRDARDNRDLINAFESNKRWKIQTV